jgi:2-oxoglutarate dehydrogenase complex dehydrogenase (E1) component-like enzyme
MYADRLIEDGLIDQKAIDQAAADYRDKLDAGEPVVELVPTKKSDHGRLGPLPRPRLARGRSIPAMTIERIRSFPSS